MLGSVQNVWNRGYEHLEEGQLASRRGEIENTFRKKNAT